MATVKSDEAKLEVFFEEIIRRNEAKRQIDQTAGPKAEPASKRERTTKRGDSPSSKLTIAHLRRS